VRRGSGAGGICITLLIYLKSGCSEIFFSMYTELAAPHTPCETRANTTFFVRRLEMNLNG